MHCYPVVFIIKIKKEFQRFYRLKTRSSKGIPYFILNIFLSVRNLCFQNCTLTLLHTALWKTDSQVWKVNANPSYQQNVHFPFQHARIVLLMLLNIKVMKDFGVICLLFVLFSGHMN